MLANEWLPSSLGVSVFLDGVPEVNVCATVATCSTVGRSLWRRNPDVVFETSMTPPSLPERSRSETNLEFASGLAAIRTTWRPFGDGWLATFTVVNPKVQSGGDGAQIDPEDCLYQVQIELSSPADVIAEYPERTPRCTTQKTMSSQCSTGVTRSSLSAMDAPQIGGSAQTGLKSSLP